MKQPNNSAIIFLINDNARCLKCEYEPDMKPHQLELFKTLDPTIKVGDYVVTTTSTRHELAVVRVVEVDYDLAYDTTENIRWIVDKIDTESFAALTAQEEEAIATVKKAERAEKKAELQKALFKSQPDLVNTLSLANHDETPVPPASPDDA